MRKLGLSILIACFLSIVGIIPVQAACTNTGCDSSCRNPQIDLVCQRRKIVNPTTNCTTFYCADSNVKPPTQVDERLLFNLFGVQVRLNSENQLNSIVFLVFSFILAGVSIALAFYGIQGAVLRSRAESDGDIQKAQKIIVNASVGFVIIVLSFLIVQVVAFAVGAGSLGELVNFNGIFQRD